MPELFGVIPLLLGLFMAADKGGGGGSDDPPDDADDKGDQPDPKDAPDDDEPDDDDLGPKGKKALDTERAARKKAEREAKKAARELADLKAAGASEDEKKIAAAKEEGKKEALTMANRRLVKAEVKSAAVGKLANPELAHRLLDLDDFEVDDDGDVDIKAIEKAVDDLVEEYPNLAAEKGGSRRSGGDFGKGGNKGKEPKMDDLIRAAAGKG